MSVSEAISFVINNFQSGAWPTIVDILITVAPIFLAVILFRIMWDLWVQYIRAKNYMAAERIVLELRLPKDTYKSPLAMETFLNALHNTSDGSKYAQFWQGNVRPYFSLELVSIEGAVKFFLWMEKIRKTNLISALYSQFPEIEVSEREDYAKSVHFDPKVTRIWGGEFVFTKKDHEPYPIKTYVDYGLDKDPKEEYKIDPLTPLLEWLGSVPPNQQAWVQIIIRAHKKARKKGHIFKETDVWEDDIKKLINETMIRNEKTKITGAPTKEGEFPRPPTLSEGEKKSLEALERRLTKHPFDVGIRAVYISPKDEFDTPYVLGGIIGSFKHFSSANLNGFKPNGKVWHGRLDYPWQDFRNYRRNLYSKQALMAYKRRSYFYPPFQRKPIVMNSEELATIYHFPGSVAATPSLERVPSKKAQAPANLPM
ncbi:hypothetical protein KGQ27_00945 [Patescibacteria group bacterium]|nr:hypothetical protein [Patescibacteria group bacterium]MDE1946588.1 hypothetical protein [Patescibacteria group bacterium]MDE2010849.1 hypothetical protein [Patescibacteria group bacterium]MDE2233215.1 hypothetical protein [Patescibacteria group bacterium]